MHKINELATFLKFELRQILFREEELFLQILHPFLHISKVQRAILTEFRSNDLNHGLRTPNEGKNQRNLKIQADVADKICCRHT